MIAKTLRKLIPALLVLALVLPCALTVPVSAASGGEQLYSVGADITGWTHNSTDDKENADGAEAHERLEYNGETITLNPIVNKNLIASGIKCMELYSPALSLSTAKELELVFRYARFAQVDYDEDINIEWAGGFRVYVSTDGGANWSTDYATLREHRALGRGYDGADMAVIYEAVSTDLSVLVSEGETINKIKIVPYGPLTDYNGFAHILSITVNAYDKLPAAPEVEYISVDEQILRQIVVDRMYETVTLPWTAPEAITGYDGTNYPAGSYLGPVYARGADTSLEMLKSFIDDEDSKYTGPVGEWTVYGMDCCGVVGDATSRITGHPTVAWAYLLSENIGTITGYDGDLPATRKTNEIVDALGRDKILECLAATQPGDLLLCRTDDNVHARLITKVDHENGKIYYSDTSWNIMEAVTNDGGETYTYTTATYGNDVPETSCRKDIEQTYAQLVPEGYTANSHVYVPYTLKEYTEGQVEKEQVNIYDAPCAISTANGVDVLLESNYHLNKVVATLTNKATGEVWTDTVYGELDQYTMEYSNATLNSKLAALKSGTKYNLTIDVHSGPVTEVGGEVPVTNVLDMDFTAGVTVQNLPAITEATTLTAGHYILTEDATAAGTITIDGEVTLCLHGHTLTKAADNTNYMFSLDSADDVLTICDCTGGGMLRGNKGTATQYGGGACIGANAGKVNIKGGTITGFTAEGAAIYLNGATATMSGGTITGNESNGATTANGGGGVYNNGTFTMTGGTISDNYAEKGGGVYNRKTFRMSGGTITGNYATVPDTTGEDVYAGCGGGIYTSSTVTLTGGTISNNVASADGGGVYSATDQFELDAPGVTITGNSAKNGGGIYVENKKYPQYGKLTMSAGTIRNNTVTGNGGGVYFAGANGFTMTGGTISNNNARTSGSSNGGGVWCSGTFTMDGGTITGNTAGYNGGGLLLSPSIRASEFTLNNGVISNNKAKSQGGAIRMSATGSNTATVNMYGGKISGNRAIGGGAISLNGASAQFNMYGGTIGGTEDTDSNYNISNTSNATPQGTALYVTSSAKVYLYGGDIAGNKSGKTAASGRTDKSADSDEPVRTHGAVYIEDGKVYLEADKADPTKYPGTQIYNNQGWYGGAVYLRTAASEFHMSAGSIGMNGEIEARNTASATGSNPCDAIMLNVVDATVNIEGGRINGKCGVLSNGTATKMTITGGEFSQSPAAYVADNYLVNKQDTWYLVIPDAYPEGIEITAETTALTGKETADEMTYYKLTGDVEIASQITVTGYVTVNYNGFDLISGVGSTAAIAVSSGGHLTLEDNDAAPYGELRMKSGITGKAINVKSGSSVTMNGGTITGFNSMPIQINGTFTLNDGRITGNKLAGGSGGAFYVEGSGTLNIQGGEITNNKPLNHGGAVYTGTATARVNVTGGKIFGNTVDDGKYGSAMYGKGTVTISGGEIQGTLVTHATDGGTITVTGGEIEGALAKANDAKGTITVSGGKFSEDPAAEYLKADHFVRTLTGEDLPYVVLKQGVAGGTVNLGNTLGIKFYFNLENSLDQYIFTVSANGQEYTGDQYITPATGTGYDYCCFYTGLLPTQMCETVSLRITNRDAERTIYSSASNSVQGYAQQVLASNMSDAVKQVVIDMLNYGAAAQKYVDATVADDALANSVLTEGQKTVDYTGLTIEDNSSVTGDVSCAGMVMLNDRMVLKMLVDASAVEAGVTEASVTFKHADNSDGSFDCTVEDSGYTGWAMVEVSTLWIPDAREMVTCTIGNIVFADSVESYAARVIAVNASGDKTSAPDELVALVKAMIKFADGIALIKA